MCFSSFHVNRFVNIPLAKPSHMAKPGMKVRGGQELQGREPNTERPVCRPFMQLSCQSSPLKLEAGQKGTFSSKIQSVLVICRFPMCKFAYLLRCVCNHKNQRGGPCTVLPARAQSSDNFELPNAHVPCAESEQDDALCQLTYCKQASFRGLLSATFFAFLCCLLRCVKWSPRVVLKC